MSDIKEYTIRSIKKGDQWGNSYGQFQSYALALEGVGEPVKLNKSLPVNKEPEAGDKLYGMLLQEEAKDGRLYYRFKAEKRPDADNKQQSIEAQFAMKLAVQIWIAQGCLPEAYSNIETEARHFLEVLDNMKQGEQE